MIGPFRSNRATLVVLGAIIFLAAFVGLAYNNLDSWDLPDDVSGPRKPKVDVADDDAVINIPDTPAAEPPKAADPPPPEPEAPHPAPADPEQPKAPAPAAPQTPLDDDDIHRQYYLEHIMKPSIGVTESPYSDFGAFDWELPSKKLWDKPIGENLCIIDIDNREWKEEGQLWSSKPMSWDQRSKVHGLSLGILNHWLYAKIHGYKYYFIDFEAPTDRRASWAKPAIIREILKHHDACVFLDSDAIIHHLDIPFEWLMNYWGLHPTTNSFALAFDPKHKNNMDKFGGVYLNTGFIVLQNNKKTYEILDAWEQCPEEGGTHPECVEFRTNRPGKPTDQGGFGTFIRYDFPDPEIISLPCTEANGFPESHSGCDGQFIRHLWTGKKNWIKVNIGKQIPGKYLEMFHKQFLAEKPTFWMKDKDLPSLGEGRMGTAAEVGA